MKTSAIRLAKRIARRVLGRPIFGRSILVYHRVTQADFDPWDIALSPNEFERQLLALRKKTVISLQEFVTLQRQRKLPNNALAITFDDGYACNALVAAPMLQSFGYPATFFVVSDAIAQGQEFWWDQLEFIFHAPEFNFDSAERLLFDYIGSDNRPNTQRDRSTNRSFFRLWDPLHRAPTVKRNQYLDTLRSQMGLKLQPRPTHRPMTTAELQSLAGNPLFEIGGHTATHPSLPSLTSAQQEEEIVSSSRFLAAMTGKPIRSFSYPFGEWEEITRDIVIAAGFECALVAENRRVSPRDNAFTLPRRQAVNRSATEPS
jgi:peptidoglycan/xylan/chitin deacetylase (PgdA/CDA1 family)